MFDTVLEGIFKAGLGDRAVGANSFGHDYSHTVAGKKDVCGGVCTGALFHPSGVHVVAAIHF